MKTLSKRVDLNHSQTGRQAAASIVEYSGRGGTLNAYPDRIISPPNPSECCALSMEQVGDVQEDGSWLFVYKRCRSCGYTVRHFLMMTPKAMQDIRVDLLRCMDASRAKN